MKSIFFIGMLLFSVMTAHAADLSMGAASGTTNTLNAVHVTTLPQTLYIDNPLTTGPVYLTADAEIEKPEADGGRKFSIYGAALTDFAIAGRYAYLAQGTTLIVLDLSDPDDPSTIFTKEFREPIGSIDLAGKALYLGLPSGPAILNITDPAHPRLHARIRLRATDVTALAVGSFLFVASGRDEFDPAFYDIRDPLRPAPVESVNSHHTFLVEGNRLTRLAPILTSGTLSNAGILPALNLVLVKSELTTGSRVLTTTQTLPLSEETALTLHEGKIGLVGTSQTVTLADLTTPTRCILHNTLAESAADTLIEHAGNVTVVSGERGYAVYRGADFDEAVLEAQKYPGTQAFTPAAVLCPAKRRGGAASASAGAAGGPPAILYTLDGKTIAIHELSDTTVTQCGIFPGTEAPQGLKISGALAAVYEAGAGLRFYDLKDPRRPVKRGRWATLTEACAIQIQDNRAYVADGAAGLKILSLASPAQPREIGHAKLPSPVTCLQVDDNKVYLTGEKNKSFYTVSAARLAAPAPRSILRLPENPRALALLKPDIAAVADGKAGLQLIDTSAPERPHVAGVYDTKYPCINLAAAGQSMLYLLDSPGIEILYCGKPAAPQLMSRIDLPLTEKPAQHIVVNGKALYVLTCGMNPALRVIDITNPTDPKIVSVFRDLHGADCLPALIGTKLCLPWQSSEFYPGGSGIQVLDVSNPLAPRSIEDIPGTQSPYAAAGTEKYLYLTLGFGGMMFLRI